MRVLKRIAVAASIVGIAATASGLVIGAATAEEPLKLVDRHGRRLSSIQLHQARWHAFGL
jgi:hypothetical protein